MRDNPQVPERNSRTGAQQPVYDVAKRHCRLNHRKLTASSYQTTVTAQVSTRHERRTLSYLCYKTVPGVARCHNSYNTVVMTKTVFYAAFWLEIST